jgi:hypothetical protein
VSSPYTLDGEPRMRETPSDDWAMLQFDSEEPARHQPVPPVPPPGHDPTLRHRVLRDAPPLREPFALPLPHGGATRQATPVAVPPRSRRRAELVAVLVGGLAFAFAVGFTVGQRQDAAPETAAVVAPAVVAPPPLERRVADGDVQGMPALAGIAVGPEVPLAPDIGQLVIRSRPAGAEVVLDGVLRGTTPLTLGRLRLGQRTLQVAFGGYDMRQRVVMLSPERPSQAIDLALTPAGSMLPRVDGATGAVQVTSRPAGARLFVNDELVGTVPLLMPGLDPGSHRVRLELAGFQSWTSSVLIEPDQRFRIDARLEPERPAR